MNRLDSIIKNSNSRKFSARLGLSVFYLLVLGDFISYSVSAATGIPSIPFGIITYSIVFVSLISYLQLELIEISTEKKLWYVIISFSLFFIATLLRVIIDVDSEFTDIYLVLRYLISLIAGVLIGNALIYYSFRKTFLVTYLLMVLVLISLIDRDSFSFQVLGQDEGNYLRIAEWFVLSAIGALCYIKKPTIATIVYIVSLIALFFINSRFALVLFFLIGIIAIVIRFRVKGLFSLFGIILISIFFIIAILEINYDLFENSRVLRLLFSPSADTSLLARQSMAASGIEAIHKNWFIGDLHGHLRIGGDGSYIHNLLSYWRQYGLISFLLFIILLSTVWINALQWIKNGKLKNSKYLFAFSYLMFTTVGILVAKAYVYTEIYLSIGIVFSFLYNEDIEHSYSH